VKPIAAAGKRCLTRKRIKVWAQECEGKIIYQLMPQIQKRKKKRNKEFTSSLALADRGWYNIHEKNVSINNVNQLNMKTREKFLANT
jgi:hypothetical protein